MLMLLMIALVGLVGANVTQLDTASFEGATQAATGQTTGIWYVTQCMHQHRSTRNA